MPLALKIAPDLDDAQITSDLPMPLRRHRIDGVIATNTTISREGVAGPAARRRNRRPVGRAGVRTARPTVLTELATRSAGELPIIGVGGIMSGADARAKIEAGASLVQIYSGLHLSRPGPGRRSRRRAAPTMPLNRTAQISR